jgi:hypothetical protein
MINFLLIVVFGLFSLGQFSNFSRNLSSGGSNLYLFDIALVILCVFGLWKLLFSVRKFFLPKSYGAFLVLLGYLGIFLSVRFIDLGTADLTTSGLYLIRFVLYVFSGLIIFNLIKFEVISLGFIEKLIIGSGILIAIVGFIQLLVLPDFTVLDASLGWDPHKNRLASTFFDPNFVGAYLVMALTLLLYRFDLKNKFHVISALVIFVAILLTFSRSAWLMLGVVILIFGMMKYRALLL